MIVTFHLVVYFAYRVWDNYISVLFGNDNDISPSNQNPGISRSNPAISGRGETDPAITPSENVNNPISRPIHENESLSNHPDQSRQVKEDVGDLQLTTESILFAVKDENCTKSNEEFTFACNYSEERGMTFIPPVYTQRYLVIENILKKPCWAENVKKVVDFGCAELTFEMRHLTNLFGIQEIVAVDVKQDLLSFSCCKAGPSPIDYLRPRPTPLTVRVFCGSVAHTHQILNDTDAVIAIELIEHLYPGDLEDLPFTIFGYIRPKIAMFTTPNSDFNILFPNFSGFRHNDHKFEWSRQQFEDWGNNLVLRYPDYSVSFQGVGPGPTGTEHLGCCSQMATFIKVYNSPPYDEDELHIQDGDYTLIQEYKYPYYVDKRTREEKLRDEAVSFIHRFCSLSRYFDEKRLSEIPLKTIMERLQCPQRETLKNVLRRDNWEIKTNADGYEVVILPDSENEDEDDLDDSEEPAESSNTYDVDCENTLINDEDWDCSEIESKVYINSSINGNSTEDSSSAHNIESVPVSSGCVSSTDNIEIKQTSFNDLVDLGNAKITCSTQKAVVPGVSVVCNTYDSSDKDDVLEKDMDLDYSIYETPCKNDHTIIANSSDESLNNEEPNSPDVCRKALSFMTPSSKECEFNNSVTFSDSSDGCARTDPFCCVSVVSSPLDISIYATPCCSRLHKNNIPKCLSLQQISAQDSDNPLREHGFISEQKDKVSKSMEGFKIQESCDMHETCSNASRVVDSGYPDSYSEHNMDMDLTPEQFDDIETESEGNDVSSRSLSPPPPPVPQVLRMVDDVQNGDVANNNRDGEGNNVVADMEEEPLEFEAQIEDVNNELPNLAAAEYPVDQIPQQCRSRSNSPGLHQDDSDKSCVSSGVGTPKNISFCSLEFQKHEQHEASDKILLPKNKALTVSLDVPLNTHDKPTLQSTDSNVSIATDCSWGHLGSCENQSLSCNRHNGINDFDTAQDPCTLKEYNSLTTVLDGCSKFSNCSLVQPIEKRNNPREVAVKDSPDQIVLQSTTTNEEGLQSTRENSDKDLAKENSSELDCLSLKSEYESAASLHSTDDGENPFPSWLLELQIAESDEHEVASTNSTMTVWGVDSQEELNYDVQVDTRGGGDLQSDPWI
uniref:Small RNA 2'-O-methyltransferase n=1 Tax=Graphocephala atropunctata TaxID=36148 RepID=A0A1B6MM70_9HEMI